MILYIDIHTGISGDMILGALIDLGVPVEWLKNQLLRIPLTGFDLRCEPVMKHHLNAANLFVDTDNTVPSRNYTNIRTLIDASSLSPGVKIRSLAAFEKIALAESAIHNRDIDTVHFHEVGGIDALVDIIGAFLCVEYLGIRTVYASTVPLGSGSVQCSHGILPVPAPATLSILKGVPVRGSEFTTEIVTPTGAAVLTTLAAGYGPLPEMTVSRIGYGAGKKDTGNQPNLLRMILGDPWPVSAGAAPGGHPSPFQTDDVVVIRTNIDDMSPEILGFLMDCLFEKGALDVTFLPVQMKKNRPGTLVEALCHPDRKEIIINEILNQTSSTGVRFHQAGRLFLKRKLVNRHTRFGFIQVKQISTPDSGVRYVPEFDVCRAIAEKNGLALKDVFTQISHDMDSRT